MANAPLVGQDGGSPKSDLPVGASEMFFVDGLDGRNRDEIAGEISSYAHAFAKASARQARYVASLSVMPGTSSAKTRFALLPGHDEI